MASDENPYFDAHVASSSSAGAATSSASAVSATPAIIATPATPDREQPPTPVGEQPPTSVLSPSLARTVQFRPVGDRQQSSIRLRRGSAPVPPQKLETIPSERELESQQYLQTDDNDNGNGGILGRQRSNSGSRSLRLAQALSFNRMPTIQDENQNIEARDYAPTSVRPPLGGQSYARTQNTGGPMANRGEYASNIVDFLDVIG
jgi:hypothetical protein